jgi:hypothetical protein
LTVLPFSTVVFSKAPSRTGSAQVTAASEEFGFVEDAISSARIAATAEARIESRLAFVEGIGFDSRELRTFCRT